MGLCLRFPKPEPKLVKAYCGEFREPPLDV